MTGVRRPAGGGTQHRTGAWSQGGEHSPLRPVMQRRPALHVPGRSLSRAAPGVRGSQPRA